MAKKARNVLDEVYGPVIPSPMVDPIDPNDARTWPIGYRAPVERGWRPRMKISIRPIRNAKSAGREAKVTKRHWVSDELPEAEIGQHLTLAIQKAWKKGLDPIEMKIRIRFS